MSRLRTIALAASAVFFGTAAESAFALDHHCKIGEPTPAAIILDGCESPKDKDLTAPITCESTPRGTATGHFDASKAIKHNGRYQPQKVLFTGNCGHETISEEKLIRILYPGESGAGDGTGPLGSVHWSFGLGRVAGNKNGGAICFDADELLPGIVRPENLVLAAQGMTDVVWAPYGARVHQILAPECFVQIDETSWSSFKVSFYRPGQVLNDLRGTNVWHVRWMNGKWQATTLPIPYEDIPGSWKTLRGERYLLNEGAAPFVSYTLSRTGPSAMAVSEERPGLPPKTTTYSCVDGVWSRNECNLRTETLRQSVANDRKTMTWTVTGTLGESFTTRETYLLVDGRELLLERVVDPDGLALVTSNEYYLSGPSRYKLRKTTDSNGAWTTYEYDDEGRQTNVSTGWLSGSEEDPFRTTLYSYAPFLPTNNVAPNEPFDAGTVDKTTARVETELIGGIPVSKTLRSIAMDTLGYRVIEEVRLLDPSETNLMAAWTDAFNPRSFSVYMPDSDYKPCSRLPMLVVNEDGTATHYTYDSGNYALGEDGLPGTFEPIVGGAFFRTVATHGTRESFGLDSLGNSSTGYAGIPMRTTRDVTIETRIGKHELLRETYVCSGADAFERIAWTTTTRNAENRIVATRSSDGTRTEQCWNGDLLAWTSGADGILHSFSYDGLGRLVSDSWTDPLTSENVIVAQTCDAEGHMIAQTKSAGNLSQSSTRAYDAAGRLVYALDANGIAVASAYTMSNGFSRTETIRGFGSDLALTNAIVSFADGQTAWMEHNGRQTETFVYGALPGSMVTTVFEGSAGTNSLRWCTEVIDALGRTVETRRPGFGGAVLAEIAVYDDRGLPVQRERKIKFPDGSVKERPSSLALFDDLGAAVVSATDANGNGHIDFAGPDVVSSNATRYVRADNVWWRETRRYYFPDAGSGEPFLSGTSLVRVSGLGYEEETDIGTAALVSENRFVDALGNVSRILRYQNRNSKATLQRSFSPTSTLSDDTVMIGTVVVTNRSATGVTTSRKYDALGRMVASTDGRGLLVSYSYDDHDLLVSATDASGITTTFGYDSLGHQTTVTNALGLVMTKSYDANGNLMRERGTTYPVDYAYDEFGNRVSMTTYRDEALQGGDTTRWFFDEATGLVTNKLYADGHGPTYSYTPDGLLEMRTWARGVITHYSYDFLYDLNSVQYSDETPDITYSRDRLGNILSAVCAGASTNLYAYNRLGQLTNEVQNGTTIARNYDSLGREAGYAIGGGAAEGSSVTYSYDTFGRFAAVASGTNVFSYSYLPGSALVSGMAANTGHAWERIYEPNRNLISTVHNHYGSRTISRFDYTNDEIGRRVSRVDSGKAFSETAFERYAYNDRSEVIGSQRFYGSDIDDLSRPVTGRTFGYGYDPIGNRVSSFENAGGEHLTTTYTANELNQYTAIQNADAVPLRGDAKRDAVVTVNGDRAERDNGTADFTPWSYALHSSNSNASFQHADILAIAQNATGEDVEQREFGSVFTPAAETIFEYDDDGNMTFDGRFRYFWNGENRMIRAEEIVVPTNHVPTLITYAYDEQGRMISKSIVGTNSVARSILWDGYNIVRETNNGIMTYNIWGLDLDGTLQGCGSIGGLLAVAKTNGLHVAFYEANGNITEYVSSFGVISAHYEYSPFGQQLVSIGESFMHQFSTAVYCDKTGILEYQLREYLPSIGRWMRRDPSFEGGSFNLFCHTRNNPLCLFDCFGLLDRKLEGYTKRDFSSKFGMSAGLGWYISINAIRESAQHCCKTGSRRGEKAKIVEWTIGGEVGGHLGVSGTFHVLGVGFDIGFVGPGVSARLLNMHFIYDECHSDDRFILEFINVRLSPGLQSVQLGLGYLLEVKGHLHGWFEFTIGGVWQKGEFDRLTGGIFVDYDISLKVSILWREYTLLDSDDLQGKHQRTPLVQF